ncbi:NupC/NupG family nucleoside CNT transporter [Kamptonema animale CS-326]|jgi:CNT family concentrative nucleoside transporter|uniref:NupC/NupG family nucleoside CNT transporter n=1 Tax=Kamptonema animale TaxID=92934 RepID=UPI00232BE080|nr:NupC/NupG family nucleoside CNT transporter [Kamptonema animale]MDB9509980.1 NupC/NupG family nucleoside CNT transporter [Kamptonema animale CS-326]
MERLISVLGLAVFVGLSYAFSVNRRAVRWAPVLWGIALQLILAVLIIRTQPGFILFQFLGDVMQQLLNFSDAGAKFVFGEKFQEQFVAFKILPTIIFFSSFVSVLYHYNILQQLVRGMAWVMLKTMKISGAESLSCAGNVFLGPTEAALLIKPYVGKMTVSELHSVMTVGFGTIAGGVMGAYLSFGVPASHLLAASVMSAPASMAISKLFYPEMEEPLTAGTMDVEMKTNYTNAIEAAADGAFQGGKLAFSVGVMLIAFLGLLATANGLLHWLGMMVGLPLLSLEWLLSFVMFPVAWLMGVPWADCGQVGILLGKKTILNDFIAYLDLKQLMDSKAISERAIVIATYAICGFANIGSIGITIGGIGGLAPERQKDLARWGVRAMIAGAIANFMTACIAGMLL